MYATGIQATTVDELAEEAGVSKLTLYRHFGSKDALLAEALRQRAEERHAELVAVLSESADWRRGVRAVFDWLHAWLSEDTFRGCAFVQAAVELGERQAAVRAVAARHKERSAEALRSYLRGAGFAQPDELASQLQLLIEGATVLAFLDRSAAHARSAERAAFALLELAERQS